MLARRLVSHAPHEMVLAEHEIPDIPPPGAILAEAAVTAISAGTEVANYEGRTANRPEPYFPGYSFAGTVLAVGDGTQRFAPGDRVCGPLPHTSRVIEGRPERLARLTTIPDGVGFVDAAFTQLGCIALNAVRKAEIALGDRVAIVGAGVVGLLASRLARLAGGRRVTSLDLLAARLEAASRNRAYAALDPSDTATQERLEEIAPGGFDIVFEATESSGGFRTALRLARPGGRVILLGSTRELVDGFDPYADVHLKGLTVLGAHVSTTPVVATVRDRWTEAANRRVLLELMNRGELDVDALVTHRLGPEDAPAAFAALASRPSDHLGVVIDWR